MNQIHTFSNQFKFNLEQITSLKQSLSKAEELYEPSTFNSQETPLNGNSQELEASIENDGGPVNQITQSQDHTS